MHQFEVVSKIGEGSFSQVFKVLRLIDGKTYALKRMRMSQLTEEQRKNCLNQIRLLANISHPNIIKYKEAFFEGRELCLIMELAENKDFQEFLKYRKKHHSPLTQEEICAYAREMINGLCSLHRTNILHRDVKAANFFLGQDNLVKLGDMNVSSISKNGMADTNKGTPYYISPQIWQGKVYSSKSDVWSFGCLLYQMITFIHPFTGKDLSQLKQNVLNGTFEPLPEDCPAKLKQIIQSCLCKNPQKRISSQELLENSYLRLKYNQFKQKTMEKSSLNNKEYKITCRRILREITQANTQNILNIATSLPKSNYLSPSKQQRAPSCKMRKNKITDFEKMTPRMQTVFQVYTQNPYSMRSSRQSKKQQIR